MIVPQGKYYLYRHIRKDTGMPFYIGIGQKEGVNRCRITSEYRRAFVHFTRNPLWKNIYKKTEIEVEILLESDNKAFIQSKEVEFVSLYGRQDNGTGILSNMTNGGDYYPLKIPDSKHGRNYMPLEKRREVTKSVYRPPLGTNPKNIYVYCAYTGNLIGKYEQQKKCAKELGVHITTIIKAIKNRKVSVGYLFSEYDYGQYLNPDTYLPKKTNTKSVQKLDVYSFEVLDTYESLIDAQKKTGICNSNIFSAIKNGHICRGFYWKIDNNDAFTPSNTRRRYTAINKIDIKTKEVICTYTSIKEAALLNGIKSTSNIGMSIKLQKPRAGYLWAKKINNNGSSNNI